MLIRYPPHSKSQWKNLVLASDFYQVIVQTSRPYFWKKDFSRICENKISVEYVQMILKLAIWNIWLRSNTQNYSHLKALYIKAYIRKIV